MLVASSEGRRSRRKENKWFTSPIQSLKCNEHMFLIEITEPSEGKDLYKETSSSSLSLSRARAHHRRLLVFNRLRGENDSLLPIDTSRRSDHLILLHERNAGTNRRRRRRRWYNCHNLASDVFYSAAESAIWLAFDDDDECFLLSPFLSRSNHYMHEHVRAPARERDRERQREANYFSRFDRERARVRVLTANLN